MAEALVMINGRVQSWERTYHIFPSQWELKLYDGRFVYVRYRHGSLGFGVGSSPDDAVQNYALLSISIHGEGRAYLADSEMIDALRKIGLDFQGATRVGFPDETP